MDRNRTNCSITVLQRVMAVIPGRPILSGSKLVSIAVSGSNRALRDAINLHVIPHADIVKMNRGSVEAKLISDVYFCVELVDCKASEEAVTH
jgi:hypothetical protein